MKGSNFSTFDVLFQYIVYDWVNVFIHIFEQEWETILNSQLQLFQEVMIIECAHLWNIFIFNLFDYYMQKNIWIVMI